MELERLRGLERYVGFDEASLQALRALHPHAARDFSDIVRDFYDAIVQHPDARAAITGGQAQVDRLKMTLMRWLDSVLLDARDAAYMKAHSRIGQVHVRIDLPQEFMFSAMSRIREGLLLAVSNAPGEPVSRAAMRRAVNQALDLELAIMLDTYREDWMRRVRASERLATIGQLAASIGHELRNPLGIMESSLFLLGARMNKLELSDPTLDKHLSRISEQVKSCGNTISSLLDMARDTPPHCRVVSLLDVATASLQSLTIPEGVELRIEISPALQCYADPHQLRQVFGNLINNALQAMEDGGRIDLRAASVPSGVELYVQDDGPGIEAEARERIFEVLFTTRARGTGLGLPLCRRIIEQHGGEIDVFDSGQPGACFRFWLPHRPEPVT